MDYEIPRCKLSARRMPVQDKTPVEPANELAGCTIDEFVYIFVGIEVTSKHLSIASKFASSERRTYNDCPARFRELHPASYRPARVVHKKGAE